MSVSYEESGTLSLSQFTDELSTLRPLNNDWSRECIESYYKYIQKDAPVEDWEARHSLYAL
jgi:hypothetical protein